MPHYPVFVVKAEIGAGIVGAVYKSVHFVLVKIYKAGITFVILVIHVIYTAFAVSGF